MTALGILKATYDGLPRHKQTIFQVALSLVVLGRPAHYTDGSDEWLIFADNDFTLNDASWVGVLAANLNSIPDTYHLPVIIKKGEFVIDRETVRSEAHAFLAPFRTDPSDIAYSESGNHWQETLDAQGAPAAIRMAASVPDSWTPVS
jgi:hypothetical protein